MGYALKPYKKVISNDIEYYAYTINQAILNGCDFSILDEENFWNKVEQQYKLLQTKVLSVAKVEQEFLMMKMWTIENTKIFVKKRHLFLIQKVLILA